MGYNKEIDYQEKINEAVKNGDYKSAADYEKSRNEKITAENLPYQKTNRYSGWLDTNDYSTMLKEQISSGASKSKVSETLKKRINKASGTDGLSQYAYDSVYDDAVRYLMKGTEYSYDYEVPEFKDSYKNEIKALMKDISNPQEFEYDLYSDDLYQYYKAQYNREGRRAMEDLLGELAMNTGGVASSYAVSAAGQMLDNYNQKLTDKIPELYRDAYDRYIDTLEINRDSLAALGELSDKEYERYADSIEQYNKDREFGYKNYTEALDRDFRKGEFEETVEARKSEEKYLYDKLYSEESENNRKWEQQEYENVTEEEQNRIDNALKKWESMGYLDSESAAILGLPEGLHTSDYDYKKAQQYRLYNR